MVDAALIGPLIPITAILSGVAYKWIKYKEKQLDAITHETAEKAARYASHTDRLEQRVRTLERIVTEKGIFVADEIDSLRDDDRVNGRA